MSGDPVILAAGSPRPNGLDTGKGDVIENSHNEQRARFGNGFSFKDDFYNSFYILLNMQRRLTYSEG